MKNSEVQAMPGSIRFFNRLLFQSILALAVLFFGIDNAAAHKPSDSFLNIERHTDAFRLRWDIALRDLEFALGLDTNQDGRLTRSEVDSQARKIGAYALSRLQLSAAGQACDSSLDGFEPKRLDDGSYASLLILASCPGGETVELDYRLFFDLDPTHRGMVSLHDGGRNTSLALSASDHRLTIDRGETSRWATLYGFIGQGVWHIWIGFDHILFLLTLLLPAVLAFRNGVWQGADSLPEVAIGTLKIVTAFTLAHSITLTLATLEVMTLPSRFVESMIAFSVIVAALNNVWPVFRGSRLVVPFGFGLIHGFGFATVLQDLGLSTHQFILSLLGFNLGVELGQLAILAVFLPLAFVIRNSAFYRWGLLRAGSITAALLATLWLGERLFDFELFPFAQII